MRPNLPAYSKVENKVAHMEMGLNIQSVEFETFERCIKRFGYCVDLNDECWAATVNETHVDIEKFKEHGNVQHSFFQHDDICDHGRYDAKKVLYISFLHCKHKQRA